MVRRGAKSYLRLGARDEVDHSLHSQKVSSTASPGTFARAVMPAPLRGRLLVPLGHQGANDDLTLGSASARSATMTNERRYQDHEIREILDLAIDEESSLGGSVTAADGLTLRQLQEVGQEVGVSSERIAQAAGVVAARRDASPHKTTTWLPTTVERTVPLARNLSDREWEWLVAELRTTFGGKGEVSVQGGMRAWTYGRVQVFIDQTQTGYRLRLSDVNAGAGAIVLGGAIVALALMIFVVLLGKTDAGFKFIVPAMFATLGGGLMLGSALSLPKWARRQRDGMLHIEQHVATLLEAPPTAHES
jgi:hypothetical protein